MRNNCVCRYQGEWEVAQPQQLHNAGLQMSQLMFDLGVLKPLSCVFIPLAKQQERLLR